MVYKVIVRQLRYFGGDAYGFTAIFERSTVKRIITRNGTRFRVGEFDSK